MSRLGGLPRELCVAFAARCELRVLPLLAAKVKGEGPFWFWGPDARPGHLLAILNAQRLSATFSAFGVKRSRSIRLFGASVAAAATDNAAYTADKINIKNVIEETILKDLDFITDNSKTGFLSKLRKTRRSNKLVTPLEFPGSPLWPSGNIPEELDPAWKRFCLWTKALDAGFDVWLSWYQGRIEGRPLTWDYLKDRPIYPPSFRRKGRKP